MNFAVNAVSYLAFGWGKVASVESHIPTFTLSKIRLYTYLLSYLLTYLLTYSKEHSPSR